MMFLCECVCHLHLPLAVISDLFWSGLITLKYGPEGNSSSILIKVMLCHTSLIFSFVNDKYINYIKLLNLGLVP